MIEISDIRLRPEESEKLLKKKAARALGISPGDIENIKILKKSLDARKKSDIRRLYTLALELRVNEAGVLSSNKKARPYAWEEYIIPKARSEARPVVVGFGPAGMFAALILAEAGLKPIVLERGGD